jgi:phage RecT family recombinase
MAASRNPPPPRQAPPPAAAPPAPKPPARIEQVRALVRTTMPKHLSVLLPKSADVERFCKVFLTHVEQSAGTRTDLTVCTDGSLARAMMHSAEVNLQVGGPYPHAWVIPYFNRDREAYEAQFQISVWGYVELMRRSGVVRKVWADVVYEHDGHELVSGTEGKIVRHSPRWFAPRAERGRVLGSYACALLENGEVICEPVSFEDLQIARAQNRGNSPAWELWPDQQYQKVAIKRLQKYVPKASILDRALEIDEDNDAPTVLDAAGVDVTEIPTDKPATSKPLDDVVAKEQAKEQPAAKLEIDRDTLFQRLCDMDKRWQKQRARVDAWDEMGALAAMAYVTTVLKGVGPDSIAPEKPAHLELGDEVIT